MLGTFSCKKKSDQVTISENKEKIDTTSNIDVLRVQKDDIESNQENFEENLIDNHVDIIFIQGWDSIGSIVSLSPNHYDSLQLRKITHLPYTLNDKFSYRIVSNTNNQRLLVLKLDIESEIYQYLLAYNKDGILISDLLVSYEDFVEYFSTISSIIKDDIIEVKTISMEDEKSDTIINSYKIMPNLTFEQINKKSSSIEE